jgi:Flp pilus assembly pilin Flp
MSNLSSVVTNPPRTHAIEYGLFISIAAVIMIAVLDATGGTVLSLYTMVTDALVAVAAT